jgi:hypothetical protein
VEEKLRSGVYYYSSSSSFPRLLLLLGFTTVHQLHVPTQVRCSDTFTALGTDFAGLFGLFPLHIDWRCWWCGGVGGGGGGGSKQDSILFLLE